MSTPKKRFNMTLEARTPPKKLRAELQESIAIPVDIQLELKDDGGAVQLPFSIKIDLPRDDLDMLVTRVHKKLRSARTPRFGWTKDTRGNKNAAVTSFTVQVKKEGDKNTIVGAYYGVGQNHIAQYCGGKPHSVIAALEQFVQTANANDVRCHIAYTSAAVDDMPAYTPLVFSFTKTLARPTDFDDDESTQPCDAGLTATDDMWLVAMKSSPSYRDLRAEGWTGTKLVGGDGVKPLGFIWSVTEASMVAAGVNHPSKNTSVYAAMDTVEQHILRTTTANAALQFKYYGEVIDDDGIIHTVEAEMEQPKRRIPRMLPRAEEGEDGEQ